MAKKKTDHIVIRNSNLFCANCGGQQVIPYPIEMSMMSAINVAFTKTHKNCKPVWKQPVVNPQLPASEKAQWWLENGERGISSETIYHYLTNQKLRFNKMQGHPSDPSDFHRCYMLLKTVPEWRYRLDKMKVVSPVWGKIVENWDKLSMLLEEQIATNKDNGMYEYMKELGC